MLESQPIQTESLILRHFTLDDSLKVFKMSQESGMKEWIPDQVYKNEQQAHEALGYLISQYEEPGNPLSGPYVLGVCLAETQELIGHVGLSPFKESVEIGYAIENNFQGKGFATKAVTSMSDWGIHKFGLSQIFGFASIDNVASCKVLESSNFYLIEELEGILHDRQGTIRKYCKTNRVPI
jgi:ribosomal-protein-alanine N-acetyltransferase